MDVWAQYDRWNEELASRYLGYHREGMPAYLAPDDEILKECADALGIAETDPLEALTRAVRPTLGLQHGRAIALERHRRRFDQWRRNLHEAGRPQTEVDELTPPPVVALLIVLVAAAKKMGSDSTEAAHAYYPRLSALLDLDAEEAAVLKDTFHVTEMFWRGINEYLELHEGLFGLPTAYALGFRYVGLPQSQALVRGGDRAKLPTFFEQFGLAPGSELVPSDLERLLDAWITTTPSPVSANLQGLWRRGSARERVSGIVAVELAHWDGQSSAGTKHSHTGGRLRLTLALRRTFGGRTAELSFAARPADVSEIRTLKVISADGQPEVGVIPAPGGAVRPTPGSKLDPDSLLGSLVEIQDPSSEQTLFRRPRRVFVMRRDELIGAWSEVDRLQLMDDFIVFVRDDERGLVAKVVDLVKTYGDMTGQFGGPGSTEREVLRGLPDGWVMLENVRLHSLPRDVKLMDLQPLLPLNTAQLSFVGGLKLPGRIRKWSSIEPPELRAAVEEADSLTIKVWDLSGERMLLDEWTESAQAVVKPLKDLELSDGDYEIELLVDAGSTPISASTVRLRSADSPDVMSWESCARLNYELDTSSTGAISAVPISDESEVLVDGVNAFGTPRLPAGRAMVEARPAWSSGNGTVRERPAPIVLGRADPTSCMVTGAHRIELPPFMGKAEKRVVEGVCSTCGIQKTFPARAKRQRHVPTARTLEASITLVAPKTRPTEVSWDTCLDALIHVGGGPISLLERIATQAEGSSLFVDEFIRTLEVLGHIDVRRGDDLQPVEWEANPAYLAETANGDFVLSGVWSAESRQALSDSLGPAAARLEPEIAEGDSITSWFVRGVDAQGLETIVDTVDDVYMVTDAVRRMLRVLPPLSVLESGLPEMGIPQYRSAEYFDVTTASWRPIPGVAPPGAYRLNQSFRKIPVWVDGAGAISRRGRLATVHLVKHLAAREAGRPLTAYLGNSKAFLVPLGAELPAVYGRVLSLCSGRPPAVSPRQRVVAYRDVPLDVAEQVQHLLTT